MIPKLASHSRVAFSSIASNTGVRSPGEELMTRSTSVVAVSRCKDSSRSARASLSRRCNSALARLRSATSSSRGAVMCSPLQPRPYRSMLQPVPDASRRRACHSITFSPKTSSRLHSFRAVSPAENLWMMAPEALGHIRSPTSGTDTISLRGDATVARLIGSWKQLYRD